jgi:hypothetical protein
VQTIDCNQDNSLVEALKLPNLLAEFEQEDGHPTYSRGTVAQQQQHKPGFWARLQHGPSTRQGPALVGFREWIFSEDSGALAEFAAATERSFGTTMQRVMHNPGGVRMHYGHPGLLVGWLSAGCVGVWVGGRAHGCWCCCVCVLCCCLSTCFVLSVR